MADDLTIAENMDDSKTEKMLKTSNAMAGEIEKLEEQAKEEKDFVQVRKKMFLLMEDVCYCACQLMKFRNPNMEKKLEIAIAKFETERDNPEITVEIEDVDKPEPKPARDAEPLAGRIEETAPGN